MERRTFEALERIPVVGRFWADSLEMSLAVADALWMTGTRPAMTDQRLPVRGPQPAAAIPTLDNAQPTARAA